MKKPAKPPLPEIVFRRRPIVLTGRERDILKLFAHGKSYIETAEELGISSKTVASYLQRVREKIRAKSRADVIAYTVAEGMLKR